MKHNSDLKQERDYRIITIGDIMATKTNAVRLVQQAKIPCRESFYEFDEKDLNGNHAAAKVQRNMQHWIQLHHIRSTTDSQCANALTASWKI